MATKARASAPAKSSRQGLSRDGVLRAAIAVADAEGIDAVTLRRLAEKLDVHPTSIYNHVPNKEAILVGIIDTMLVEADLPLAPNDWAAWIRDFAAGIRRLAQAHPGAFGVFLRQAGTGPLAARYAEAALDAFRRAGCSVEQAVRAYHGVSLVVLGLAMEEGPTGPTVAPDLGHLTADEHPRIFEVEAANLNDADTTPTWDLVIESLIAGYAATLPVATSHRKASSR